MVYVLDYNGKPLMPTSNAIARLLLKQGKAKVKRTTPFTIKLNYKTETEFKQFLTLGVDTGSSKIGTAVVDRKNNVMYISQIEIRNDITEKMSRRSKYRRNRRNRKTRYRKARWLNRRNSIRSDRFSPTIRSKIDSHIKEINFVKSILPIMEIIIETGTFDMHAMKNPEVLYNKRLYGKGLNYGFANTKAYVLTRDGYKCQYCAKKSKNSRLEVHHIIFRKNGGSDDASNLITLCADCHSDLHKNLLRLPKSKSKGSIKSDLNHATQMNSIRTQLLKRIPNSIETFGYITKTHRECLDLEKEHYNDAITIACLYNILRDSRTNINFKTNNILFKKCISDGDHQQTKGVRSEKRIPTGKICGFRKFDKVKYLGREYFIKGRMSSGYAILMDIDGNKIDLKPTPKLNNMERISARKSWIMSERHIVNIA